MGRSPHNVPSQERLASRGFAGLETCKKVVKCGKQRHPALYMVRQVHGTRLFSVEPGMDPIWVQEQEADAIATCKRGVFVGVQTADCGPILLAASDGSMVCAVHAGWRGSAAGIVQQTVQRLCEQFGMDPCNLVAAVGPCIGPQVFEVRQNVLDAFAGQHHDCFARQATEHWLFNLPRWLALTLNACGVSHVETLDICTYNNPKTCFSYRRAKHKGKTSGRQLSFIGIC